VTALGRARRRWLERAGEALVTAAGFASVVAVLLICVFLFREAAALFSDVPAATFFFSTDWYPDSERFGVLPLLAGTAVVSAGALVIAVPLGIAAALYIGEVAPARLREWLKPAVEMLAAVPSVVIGFLGLAIVAPYVKEAFHLRTGLTALTGSVALAIMALPTIVTISEDALAAVPRSYREASLALGATRWQTTWRVTLPAAGPGVLAAVILGVGRAIGETMAVWMLTGNAAQMPLTPLAPVRTMTATIAAEMGETVQGSPHYHALFALGALLFAITLAVNGGAAFFLARARAKAGGAR
jgi:phosphate transport system permease protein